MRRRRDRKVPNRPLLSGDALPYPVHFSTGPPCPALGKVHTPAPKHQKAAYSAPGLAGCCRVPSSCGTGQHLRSSINGDNGECFCQPDRMYGMLRTSGLSSQLLFGGLAQPAGSQVFPGIRQWTTQDQRRQRQQGQAASQPGRTFFVVHHLPVLSAPSQQKSRVEGVAAAHPSTRLRPEPFAEFQPLAPAGRHSPRDRLTRCVCGDVLISPHTAAGG